MQQNLEKIHKFIKKHHLLNLATCDGEMVSACALFYAFAQNSFVVASSEDTTHIKHIQKNPKVAGSIALETKIVGKIEGLQFRGEFLKLEDAELKSLYLKTYPYAIAMNPTLWQIKVEFFKLTDNKLGFGKKLIWQGSLA